MDQTPIVPYLYSKKVTNRPEMIGGEMGIHNGGNTFSRHVFVVLTSGILAAVASTGVSTCGFCLDKSWPTDVINPPTQFFGDRHFPVALEGQRFAITVTDASAHFGQANGAPQTSAVAVGTKYGILLSAGVHYLNSADTTNLFFNLVEIPSTWNGVKQDANTYNPVVIVEVIGTIIQKV